MLLYEFMFDSGLTQSKANAKRLIAQGAVKVNGKKVSSLDKRVEDNDIVAFGTRARKYKES